MLKKTGLITLILLLTLPILSASTHAQDNGTFSLTIMHTNDTHAAHDPDREGNGGVAREATVVRQIRAEASHSLLLDGGDRFTGSLYHSYYQGIDSARVMVELGFDAMVLGSYEFTHGAQTLADFIEALDFPVVVANVDFSGSSALAGKMQPYTIVEFDSEPVGIIGITRADARVRPIPELEFSDNYVEITQNAIDDLTSQGVNKIILISHLGYFDDLEIATQLTGIDIIVGGDSNTLLSNTHPDAEGPYPAIINSASSDPVAVVQAAQQNRFLGRLDAVFNTEGILVEWSGDAIELTADIEPDPDMEALITELSEPLEIFRAEVIGETQVRLDGSDDDYEICRFEECTMGNLITDAMRESTSAQIAFQNGGGIRASIEIGVITVDHVLQVLPFNNTYVIFELSGIDIIAALENGVSRTEQLEGNGRFLQVSGLRYSWDGSQNIGRRIVSVEVMNEDGSFEPLDPDDIYTVATNDFLYAGADDYTMFSRNSENGYDYGLPLDGLVRDYIAANSPIFMQTEGRITRLDRP